MTRFPTELPASVDPVLAAKLSVAFPTIIPDPEKLVYDYVVAARDGELAAAGRIRFFDDERPGQPQVPVVRGWPQYPGVIPAIGVADASTNDEQQMRGMQGGFIGDVAAYDDDVDATLLGTAAYYAESQISTVIVQLIHENRDERDRLHNELRRTLMPLERYLPTQDPQIFSATVASEKGEASGGPPVHEAPFTVYLSIITVTTTYEVRQPAYITPSQAGVVERIDVVIEAPPS